MEQILKLAKKIIGQPLTYKNMVAKLKLPYTSGKGKKYQLEKLKRYMNIQISKNPTRYTILNIYEKEKSRATELKLKEKLQDYCKKRYINILTPFEKIKHLNDNIEYICKFHPNIIQKSTVRQLIESVGCPLCKYHMSRFETMLFLGINGAKHRQVIEGIEYDILIPDKSLAIEIDGHYFHKNDIESGKEEKKYKTAQDNGLKLIKIIEQPRNNNIYQEEDKIYITYYGEASIKDKNKIIDLMTKNFGYQHSDELWDKAADYMREWKNRVFESNDDSKIIKQYDKNNNLINTYRSFKEIQDTIESGEAFGFKWIIS